MHRKINRFKGGGIKYSGAMNLLVVKSFPSLNALMIDQKNAWLVFIVSLSSQVH